MKKINKKLAFCLSVVIVLTGCSSGSTISNTQKDENTEYRTGEEGTKALYIYMCGSTLETKNGAATKNIAEILEADVPENTKIIIETGGAKKWRDYDIPSDGISRYEVKNHELSLIEKKGQVCMGSEDTFTSFLDYCTLNYPAEEMSVILWDHGSGSVSGACYDENYQMDSLTLEEMDHSFETIAPYLKNNLEFVGFDACLMANLDVASIIEKYADHMIASEELEPSGGWDYKTLISSYGQDDFYDQVLSGYAAKCDDKGKDSYTLSAIDLSKFAEVRNVFSDFVTDSMTQGFESDMQGIVVNADDSMKFGYFSGTEGYSNLIDLVDFTERSKNAAMKAAVKDMISVVNGSEKDGACGLSLYFPLDGKTGLEDYAKSSQLVDYSTLLASNFSDSSKKEWVKFEDLGSDANGELHVKLDANSQDFVKKVVYRLYMFKEGEDGEENAYCMGYNTDVANDGANGYTTSFGGKWFTLNHSFINCTPIYQSGTITTFSTPVICDKEQGTLRFTYNSSNDEIHMEGFLPENASDGSAARLENISDKKSVTVEYDDRTDSFTESLKQGDTFQVADGLDLKMSNLEDGFFVTYMEVTDIYGNLYHSDSAVLELVDQKLQVYELVGDLDYSKL